MIKVRINRIGNLYVLVNAENGFPVSTPTDNLPAAKAALSRLISQGKAK